MIVNGGGSPSTYAIEGSGENGNSGSLASRLDLSSHSPKALPCCSENRRLSEKCRGIGFVEKEGERKKEEVLNRKTRCSLR